MLPVHRVRQVGNWANVSTPLGLLIARVGGCTVARGPRGLHLADGYRLRFPYAGAFAVGNVLLSRQEWSHHERTNPSLLQHEEAHTWQWAALGPLFLPAYAAAMGWSWLRTGDRASANWFEIRAGLDVGGYVRLPLRPLREGLADAVRVARAQLSRVSGRDRSRADGRNGPAAGSRGADAVA
ncbi:hypothetical protein ACQBAU_03745 [Propionibacteriaceae bacterium Y2011]|uniref:hypothetical protein n=1 Tax=Microlunatus sp. Y2014 TaxID=3418488 RepID=UPI003B45C100